MEGVLQNAASQEKAVVYIISQQDHEWELGYLQVHTDGGSSADKSLLSFSMVRLNSATEQKNREEWAVKD